MVPNKGYTVTPHHRQNRRRERPGSRTRRTITRKSAVQSEYAEGLLDAFDIDVRLPSDKSQPSPLLRQNFDQSWQRWKAREAEEKALAAADMERLQVELEQERLKLFGGEVDEDELYRLGILYDGENLDNGSTLASSIVEVPTPPPPTYILRQAKPRRSRRSRQPLTWHPISLYLSLSNLQDDYDIARLLSPPTKSTTPMIQHQPKTTTPSLQDHTPLSLPSTLVSALSSSAHGSQLNFLTNDTPEISTSSILLHSLPPEDWTFITSDSTTYFTPSLDSPASEPETWILLSDDL